MIETLHALLAATPEPPPLGSDPEVLLSAAKQMMEARAEVLASAGTLSGGRDHPIAQQILARQERWTAALTLARGEVAERLQGLARLRSRRTAEPR
jgi:hypothetical protein